MATGWVKVYRSLMENDLWKDRPFSRGQAWVDLIMLAAHKDTEFYFDSALLPVKKGEIITSKRKLGIRWGWSNSKVDKFLNELEKVEMLAQKSDTKKTTIKITKYSQYQGFESIAAADKTTHKTTQKRQRGDTEATQKRTYNNVKNDKKVKKEKNIEPAAPFSPSGESPSEEDLEYEAILEKREKMIRGKRNGHI